MFENYDGDYDDDVIGGEGRPGDAGVQLPTHLVPPELLLFLVSDHVEGASGDEVVHLESAVTDPSRMSQCQCFDVSLDFYFFNSITYVLNRQFEED